MLLMYIRSNLQYLIVISNFRETYKSGCDHMVSLWHDPQRYESHDGSFIVINQKEEVDYTFANGNFKSSANVS